MTINRVNGKVAGGWLAVCVATVGAAEGLRTAAYKDPVGIPTICFGETKGVKMGDRSTPEECKALLASRLMEFNDGVNRCIHVPMSDNRRAAVVSFSYNAGVGAFCASTFARKLNAEDEEACKELRKWVYASGPLGVRVVLPGLKKRRQEEERLCNS